MAHLKIVVGVLILTVTVLLSTRPTEAACTDDAGCNGGKCTVADGTCDCSSVTGKTGETCTDDCTLDSDCENGGTCSDSKTCVCGDYKGTHCDDECTDNTHCGDEGTCETGPPRTCTCKDTSKKGPGCTQDSGASAVTNFSLISLFVILIGQLL